MAGLPWFRMYVEAIDDEKLRMLAFEDRWHFVAILCLKHSGLIDDTSKLKDRKIAVKMGLSLDELYMVRNRLIEAELIDQDFQPQEFWPTKILRPSSDVWRRLRAEIFERDDYTCQYCGARGTKLECDHVMPVSQGGGHGDDNLVTACFDCNRKKRNKLPEEWWDIFSKGGI